MVCNRCPDQAEAFCRAQRSNACRRPGRPSRGRSSSLSWHGSLRQFEVERARLVLTMALGLGFLSSRCVLAVIATVVLMLRNGARTLRVAALFFICHSVSPVRRKGNPTDGQVWLHPAREAAPLVGRQGSGPFSAGPLQEAVTLVVSAASEV